MKLKQKPLRPQRTKKIECYCVDEGDSLEHIVLRFQEAQCDLSAVKFYLDYDNPDECGYHIAPGASFIAYRDETDEEFESRMNDYRKSMKIWNEWNKTNEEAIKVEKIRREEVKTKAKKMAAMARRKNDEKEFERLKKRLNRG